MPHWKSNLALLWVSQLFVMVGFASTMPYVAMRIEDRGTVFGVQSTAHVIGIMLSTGASGALIYRLGASPATADWGVRGMFLAAAALSFLFLPACWAMVRRRSATT